MNGTCSFEVFPGACADRPDCPPVTGAPMMGTHWLTAVALLLATLGVLGLRTRLRRRS
jgi:hypothetical protein